MCDRFKIVKYLLISIRILLMLYLSIDLVLNKDQRYEDLNNDYAESEGNPYTQSITYTLEISYLI